MEKLPRKLADTKSFGALFWKFASLDVSKGISAMLPGRVTLDYSGCFLVLLLVFVLSAHSSGTILASCAHFGVTHFKTKISQADEVSL